MQPGLDLLTVPLFNPTGGYASYVVPAAFVLILQQTLLMGAAMLGGVGLRERRHAGALGRALGRGRPRPGARPSDRSTFRRCCSIS